VGAIRYRDIEYPIDLEAEEDGHIDIGALPRGKGERERRRRRILDERNDVPFFHGLSKGMNFAFRIII